MSEPLTRMGLLRSGRYYFRETRRGFGTVHASTLLRLEALEDEPWLFVTFRPTNAFSRTYRPFERKYPMSNLASAMGLLTRVMGKPPTMVEKWLGGAEKPHPWFSWGRLPPPRAIGLYEPKNRFSGQIGTEGFDVETIC